MPWTLASSLFVAVLAAAWAFRPLAHDDLFFHLRTGELVLAGDGVPRSDPFSYTGQGARWISHEWGFGVLCELTRRAGGWLGLRLLAVALVLGTGWFVRRRMVAGTTAFRDCPWLPALLAVAAWSSAPQWVLRAALVTSFLLSVLMWLLDRVAQRRAGWWATPLLFALWANLHSGVVFGLLLLGLRVATALQGDALERRRWLSIGALSTAVCFANPNGYQTLLYPFRLQRFLAGSRDYLYLGHFGTPSPADHPGFYLLLALFAAALCAPPARRDVRFHDGVASALFCGLALSSHRFILEMVVVCLPPLYRALRLAVERWPRLAGRARLPNVLLASGLALTGAIAWRAVDQNALARNIPVQAAELLADPAFDGSMMFNHQNFGGYLGWRLRRPVFWDGRNLLFARLIRDVSSQNMDSIRRRFPFDHLVITELEARSLAPQLTPGSWGLIFWDDWSAIYVERTPRYAAVLAQRELRLVPPFGGVPWIARTADDEALAAAARADLSRVLEQAPECQRAWYYLSRISVYRGEIERARDELARAAAVGPNPQVEAALQDLRSRQP